MRFRCSPKRDSKKEFIINKCVVENRLKTVIINAN